MKVFYRPEQSAQNAGAFSPSAAKPGQVVSDWLRRELVQPEDVRSFEPATREQIKRAHDGAFVDGVLDQSIANGFGNRDARVAASLPYTSGSLLAACRHALANSSHVCSPIRDHLVFESFQGKPLAWTLAGGYQRDPEGGIEPELKIHRSTAIACKVQAGEWRP